ncbi:hypothetical protein L6452_00684 [Arctium lappa]|uniref:Uncharacterized protein n=1 Tax=Arctium lappa TaxID=4217 RepID=A0ACB9FEL2_ARCLA|nr:hypothetical protein L6452_00684 [Arctium lappa]
MSYCWFKDKGSVVIHTEKLTWIREVLGIKVYGKVFKISVVENSEYIWSILPQRVEDPDVSDSVSSVADECDDYVLNQSFNCQELLEERSPPPEIREKDHCV